METNKYVKAVLENTTEPTRFTDVLKIVDRILERADFLQPDKEIGEAAYNLLALEIAAYQRGYEDSQITDGRHPATRSMGPLLLRLVSQDSEGA